MVNDPQDLLSLVGLCGKRKAYIPKWMVRQLCPQATLIYSIEPNMQTFEVLYDSVEKFFRSTPNIDKVYINMTNNLYDGGDVPNMIDHSSYRITCSFRHDLKKLN